MLLRFGSILLVCSSLFLWIVVISADPDPILTPTQALYDLNWDPTESQNLYKYENYTGQIQLLQDRISYWSDLVYNPSIPDTSSRENIWTDKGGVVPWVSTDFQPMPVEKIYNYLDAPNIVFVMIDDWGWNDFGSRSTYLSWTTPAIDSIAAEGILLSNYHTYQTCAPSRGAFLTGRYPLRLGMWETHDVAELPLDEFTLAQELKSAGYRNYLIGKWHVGSSTNAHLPTSRGFDYSYGYLSSYIDYWTKTYNGHLDLRENNTLINDVKILDPNYHSGYLFQSKAEEVIRQHKRLHPYQPMFLYYAMQLVHNPWTAPEEYSSRCEYPVDIDDLDLADSLYNMCGMNIMLDEAIANLTCVLNEVGMSENTVMIIVSDNGGESVIPGNSYPFKGHKGSFYRGGVSSTAIVHSKSIPVRTRGSVYDGLVHVTGKSCHVM